jgi:hypothetical protein
MLFRAALSPRTASLEAVGDAAGGTAQSDGVPKAWVLNHFGWRWSFLTDRSWLPLFGQ